MTLHFTGSLDRTAVLHGTDLVAALAARPEVAAGWAQESACAGMSVGGLTRHLASQVVNIIMLSRLDPSESAGAETLTLLEHYERVPWVHEDLAGTANRSIREAADQQASDGPAATLGWLAQAHADLDAVLADPPATLYVPWQGWSLTFDDFLVTRLMEMVVHSDDLAASVTVPTPEFGPAVLDPVLRLLTALAVRRHGQDALVRTLSRPQRAPATVSAF